MKTKNKLDLFLMERTDSEIGEIRLRMSLVSSWESMAKNLEMTKEQFRKEFKLDKRYFKGAKDFSIMDMAKIEAKYIELMEKKMSQELKEDVIKINYTRKREESSKRKLPTPSKENLGEDVSYKGKGLGG